MSSTSQTYRNSLKIPGINKYQFRKCIFKNFAQKKFNIAKILIKHAHFMRRNPNGKILLQILYYKQQILHINHHCKKDIRYSKKYKRYIEHIVCITSSISWILSYLITSLYCKWNFKMERVATCQRNRQPFYPIPYL